MHQPETPAVDQDMCMATCYSGGDPPDSTAYKKSSTQIIPVVILVPLTQGFEAAILGIENCGYGACGTQYDKAYEIKDAQKHL